MKKLCFCVCFLLTMLSVHSQTKIGLYQGESEYLNLKPDSTVEFELFVDMGDGLAFLHQGMGTWKIADSILIIKISPSLSPANYKSIDDNLRRLKLIDHQGEAILVATCKFFDQNDSLIEIGSTDFDGLLFFKNPDIDSIFIYDKYSVPTGLKVEKGKSYELTLEEGLVINEGQIILFLLVNDGQNLNFKLVDYSKNIPYLTEGYLSELKTNSKQIKWDSELKLKTNK